MNRIEEIEIQIGKLLAEKSQIQLACTHPPICVRYRHDSNTGNYDRFDDSYWTSLRCTLCGKRWTLDGGFDPGVGACKISKDDAL